MNSKYTCYIHGLIGLGALLWPVTLLAAPATPIARNERVEHKERHQRLAEEGLRRRTFPLETIPVGARQRALDQTRKFETPKTPGSGLYTWHALGPAPITLPLDPASPQSGRVTCVAVDPLNNFHWLLGSAQGGIWETYDAGGTWVARTDDQASLAIGAIAYAPSSPSVIYAGTGEANFSGDSYAGAGLLVSYNNGTNWQMLSTSFAQTAISRIQVDPSQHNNLSLATVRGVAGKNGHGSATPPTAPARGVFVSYNGGGIWSHALTGEATDLAMDPFNFNRQYAALGEIFGDPTNGVYRTTNHWLSSELVNGPWTSISAPTNIGRIALAVAPSSSQTLYVALSYEVDQGGLVGIWRGDNAWSSSPTWTRLTDPSIHGIPWYAFALSVDPNDASVLYLAELSVQRHNSGFWTDVGQFIHPDNHAMTWVPWGGFPTPTPRLLLGNDGGLWFSGIPVSSSWSSMNGGGLEISQIWKGSVHPQPNHGLALAGTQDNGTVANQGNLSWKQIQDGDGSDSAIASSNPDIWWATSWETFGDLNIYRTTDAGDHLEKVTDQMDDANAPFFVHFEKSTHNDDLFIAGTVQLWRCTNFFTGTIPAWQSNSPVMLDNAAKPVAISAIAFAPSDANSLIYAFGTDDGQLRITSNAGGTWRDLDPTNGVPNRFITALAFSPTDPNVLYVTLSGFDEGTPSQPGHVFKTSNALSNSPAWVNVSPAANLPMNCLAINPVNPAQIFVGADIGVWTTSNGGGGWTHLGPTVGMPNVAVYDLRMNSVGQVTAFTHGRGAFTYTLTIPIIQLDGPIIPHDLACLTCPPVNFLNPGDLVTVEFPLQNVLPIDTVNLTATMLPSAQITPVSGTQTYGALAGQGPAIKKSFSFRAALGGGSGPVSCGGTVQVVLQLQDEGNDLGQVSVPFRLGVPSHPLSEDFENTTVPGLPPGWDTSPAGSAMAWMTTSNAPPNSNPVDEPDQVPDLPSNSDRPPNVSVFAPVLSGSGQTILYTRPFPVSGSIAQFYFQQAFGVSNSYDGCILEISVAGGPFQEFTQAGGSFAQYGYNRTLNDHNPLGPRSAWSGDSGGWLPTLANFPATATGQSVQLRWRMGTASGDTNGFWFVDSVAVTDPQCLPPVSNPLILNPTHEGNQFSFSIGTVTSRTYLIEYKTNLLDANWQFLQSLFGNGATQTVSMPINIGNSRFFRFRVE